MTFNEWWEAPRYTDGSSRDAAEKAWGVQQAMIEHLERQLAALRDENEGLLAAIESLGCDNAALLQEKGG